MQGEKLEYSLEAFETGTRLHRREFEVYGMAGRSIPNEEMSNPTVKIRCGSLPTVIPAGTPIAFAVQKCKGVPTYIGGTANWVTTKRRRRRTSQL